MLDMARTEAQKTANPPLPWMFFIAMAILLAIICAAQVLGGSAALVVTILGMLLVAALGIRFVFYRPGYGVVWPDGLSVYPYLIAGFIVVGIPAVLAAGTGIRGLWLISAVGAAGATLIMGSRYRKAVSRRD